MKNWLKKWMENFKCNDLLVYSSDIAKESYAMHAVDQLRNASNQTSNNPLASSPPKKMWESCLIPISIEWIYAKQKIHSPPSTPPKTTSSFPRLINSEGRALRFHFFYTTINNIFQAKDDLSFYSLLRTYKLNESRLFTGSSLKPDTKFKRFIKTQTLSSKTLKQ